MRVGERWGASCSPRASFPDQTKPKNRAIKQIAPHTTRICLPIYALRRKSNRFARPTFAPYDIFMCVFVFVCMFFIMIGKIAIKQLLCPYTRSLRRAQPSLMYCTHTLASNMICTFFKGASFGPAIYIKQASTNPAVYMRM